MNRPCAPRSRGWEKDTNFSQFGEHTMRQVKWENSAPLRFDAGMRWNLARLVMDAERPLQPSCTVASLDWKGKRPQCLRQPRTETICLYKLVVWRQMKAELVS